MIVLGDDGTMDTVLRCTDCGQEFRFNYDPSDDVPVGDAAQQDYDAWVDSIIDQTQDEHVCRDDQ
jgi:hypothetical protein